MKSFRTEIENPIVEQDIIELERKIRMFKEGRVEEERFRSLRLARGVYGQRQQGVQMIRIKLPYGKLLSKQLHRIADVSDEYSTGKLHITTRQDIQIHYVDLERTPELWAELEKDAITLREACGNTVRNVTASETAGIDVDEPFDVSPYADAVFRFFLRNPICQEMGRKFKVAFSATDADTGLTYMNDLGFIAKVQQGQRGFKVMIGGGLGAQPRQADVWYEFLPSDRIIPLMEAVLRVFDRHGERSSRSKARLKFLIKKLGLDTFKRLAEEESLAIEQHVVPIPVTEQSVKQSPQITPAINFEPDSDFKAWKTTNVIPQKQEGFVAIGVKVMLGDFSTIQARKLANLVEKYAAGELRLSLRQNLLIPFVRKEVVPFFYQELKSIELNAVGYNKAVDITACPGTDTCNLGIASSTGIARKIEEVIQMEYPAYLKNEDVVIKISGCMNACGQHTMAHIGFQGMSIRTADKRIAPALQVLLGGHNKGNGRARFADKVIKIPSKRGPEALRRILNDFEAHAETTDFSHYYETRGEHYFYQLLVDLADTTRLTDQDFIDWGTHEKYVKAIGVGECAGVVVDLVETLFFDTEERLEQAEEALSKQAYSNAVYYSYGALVNTAKALLIAEGEKTNTQVGIITQFDEYFVDTKKIPLQVPFSKLVYQIKRFAPGEAFAKSYLTGAQQFLALARAYRSKEVRA